MKTKLIILLLFCGMLGAEEKPTGDGHFFIDPDLTRLIVQVIDSVTVSNWLEVKGEKSPGSIGASVASPTQFKPEDTTIVAKREPVVTKRDDGTWAITFPKEGSSVAWQGRLVYAAWRLGHSVEAGTILVNPMGERVERTSDHWSIEYSDKELGLRSDGTVVWREVKP